MLKIKLARFGKRNQPHYRIVVNTDREKRDGKYVALLGHYAPAQNPKILEIDVKEFKEWLKKGAQPTETVAALFKRFESKDPFPAKKPQLSRKAKAKAAQPKEEAAPVEAPTAETPAEAPVAEAAAEAPAEEVKTEAAPTAAVETPAAEAETPAA